MKLIADFGIDIPSFGLDLPDSLRFTSFGFSVDEPVLKNFLRNCLFSVRVFGKSVGVRGDFAKELSAYGLNMLSLALTFGRLKD